MARDADEARAVREIDAVESIVGVLVHCSDRPLVGIVGERPSRPSADLATDIVILTSLGNGDTWRCYEHDERVSNRRPARARPDQRVRRCSSTAHVGRGPVGLRLSDTQSTAHLGPHVHLRACAHHADATCINGASADRCWCGPTVLQVVRNTHPTSAYGMWLLKRNPG
jgi:hypothetical protein